jgi:alkanesulfonate monooxygenase SsuD/methylene tetrahydromethanopterin reductase-like flavin-dependent oxidoreductase (luciferase family)
VRVGLHALGIGDGARPEVIRVVAATAEAHGFATLWAGEHVVLVDSPVSRYPYSADGRIAVPADADWLDPLLALSFAAAVTSRIGLATGVLLLPEHNPAAEYVAAMRALWSDEVASFDGEFTRFEAVRVNPRPAGGRQIPIVVGGNSDAALNRAAVFGNGWYGFNLPAAAVAERVSALASRCARRGRAPGELTVAVALSDGSPALLADLAEAGVTELVVAGTPPADPDAASRWVADLAARWMTTGS